MKSNFPYDDRPEHMNALAFVIGVKFIAATGSFVIVKKNVNRNLSACHSLITLSFQSTKNYDHLPQELSPINPSMPTGCFNPYELDMSISRLRVVRCIFYFIFDRNACMQTV